MPPLCVLLRKVIFKFLEPFSIAKRFQTSPKLLGGYLKPWGVAPNSSVCLLCKKRNPVGISKIVKQFLKQPAFKKAGPKLYVSFATYM
jgi:hypothetical protein